MSAQPESELDRLRAKNLTPAELRYRALAFECLGHWAQASWYKSEADAQRVAHKVAAQLDAGAIDGSESYWENVYPNDFDSLDDIEIAP